MKKTLVWATIFAAAAAWTITGKPVPAHAATYNSGSMSVKVAKAKHGYAAKVSFKGKRVAAYKFKRKPRVKFVTHGKLTYEKLVARKGKTLYVEICEGKVLNNKGDGRITNTKSRYNYISYKRTGFRKGTRVRTYLVYNPHTDYEDDITYRFDEKSR